MHTIKLLLTEISVHTGNICSDIFSEIFVPHCVRSIRLECQNKYFLVWTSSSVNKSIICVEYSFYVSNICSVFQMFVPYFKYLFYISNVYSQFEIFVLYPKSLCYISDICSVLLKWLYSLPSLFCTSISILF